ncbi:MAG: DUF4422 domain-containing protein [Dorea sp.]|jgi:hypothetical protein|nr:DUF4422 domain-containing protein [Dorea sp.]
MSVYVITHKKFDSKIMYDDDYRTLLVGAYKGHVCGDLFDDTGTNISKSNSNYCELTGLYWLWKNCDDDYIGIVHYRRFFTHSFKADKALTKNEIKKLLKKYDVILPFHTRYKMTVKEDLCIESVRIDHLEEMERILKKRYPEYYEAYLSVFNGKKCSLYNMMIIKKELFYKYCEWLFSILFELEETIDLTNCTDYQKRIYGFLSERLINVWIRHNQLKVGEVGIIPVEVQRDFKTRVLTGLKRVVLYRLL